MKRPDPTEAALETLSQIRRDPSRFDLHSALPPLLRHRSGAVVAKAVRLTPPELHSEVVEAFRRLAEADWKRDPGCAAKEALVTWLIETGDSAEVYFRALALIQMEPSWGKSIDTAGHLRGLGAIGLTRIAHPEALLYAGDLLHDAEKAARIGALRALAESGRPEAELLLRYKARAGDLEADVISECLRAILRLGPRDRAIPFVSNFVERDDETAESAALALGESRFSEAISALRSAFEKENRPSVRAAILLGMALTRSDEMVEFLLSVVENGREPVAKEAMRALAVYENDPKIAERLAATRRGV